MNRFSRVVLGAGLALGTATAAQAQGFGSCSGAVAPVTDANWSLVYRQFSGGSASTATMTGVGSVAAVFGANPAATSLANAVCETTIPSPPWEANSPVSRWMGVNATASIPGFGGDDIMRFQYEYTVNAATFFGSPVRGSIGWDNNLIGVRWNSSLAAANAAFGSGSVINAVLGSSPNFNNDGFCRADGEFVAPPCLASFNLGAAPAGNNWLTIVMVGDGLTDGLNIRSVVPEPSTYALVGAGLLGMFGVARRRRSV